MARASATAALSSSFASKIFRVWVLDLEFWVLGFEFRVEGLGFWVLGFGF